MAKKKCHFKGQLVGAHYWIPDHPAELNEDGGIVPAIGCNRIRCKRCKKPVRVIHRATLEEHDKAPFATLYAAPEDHPAFLPENRLNLYLCPCHAHSEHSTRYLADRDDRRRLDLPWACSGHPPMRFPATLDGIPIDLEAPLEPLVLTLLTSRRAEHHPGHANLPGFQAVRVYRLLLDENLKRRMSTAVAQHLTHATPLARLGALGFFRLEPQAEGARTVLSLKRKRKMWADPDPFDPECTLRDTLELTLDAIEVAG